MGQTSGSRFFCCSFHAAFFIAVGLVNQVLRNLSFRLEPGRILGLLGRTGSGKTTISRLLFRFYDPTSGTIRLGGADTRQARLTELRHRVAIVSQDVQLFSGTVRDNLTFFNRSMPRARSTKSWRARPRCATSGGTTAGRWMRGNWWAPGKEMR